MKKYREELNQIHMSEELKQRIRRAAIQQEQPIHRKHWKPRFVYGCTALCAVIAVCFGLYYRNTSQPPKKAAQVASSIEKHEGKADAEIGSVQEQAKESKTGSAQNQEVPVESYYPQTHLYMYGAGTADRISPQKKKVKAMPYENDHLDVKGALPVFKKQYGNGPSLTSIPEKDLKEQEKKAEKLFQALKKKTSKSIQITDIMADVNGELRLILKTDKKEGTRTQQHEIAEELLKIYPELFTFQDADIQTRCYTSMGSGIMACQTDIFKAEDDDKQSLLNQVTAGAVLTDAGDGVYYLSLPYNTYEKQLQEFTIMSSGEAEQVLNQGGYYSTLPPSEISVDQLEILHVELTYGGGEDMYASYLPYVIPIYRFYTWDTKRLRPVLLEVPALYPQDLRELKENTWYFTQ